MSAPKIPICSRNPMSAIQRGCLTYSVPVQSLLHVQPRLFSVLFSQPAHALILPHLASASFSSWLLFNVLSPIPTSKTPLPTSAQLRAPLGRGSQRLYFLNNDIIIQWRDQRDITEENDTYSGLYNYRRRGAWWKGMSPLCILRSGYTAL